MALFDFLSRGKEEKTKKEATEALKKMREKKKEEKGLGEKVAKKATSAIEKKRAAEKELLESL